MRSIYTRKFGVPAEIPPGYCGSAFPQEAVRDRIKTKDNCLTEAPAIPETDEIGESDPGTASPEAAVPGTNSPETASPETASPETASPGTASPGTASPGTASPGTASPGSTSPGTASPEQKRSAKEGFGQLLELLRGKIGTEELILTLVLLLISSDEIGAETVILVLALLAG